LVFSHHRDLRPADDHPVQVRLVGLVAAPGAARAPVAAVGRRWHLAAAGAAGRGGGIGDIRRQLGRWPPHVRQSHEPSSFFRM